MSRPRTSIARSAVMSSARTGDGRDDWGTPAYVFEPLHREFGFDFDVACTPDNALAMPVYNGLSHRCGILAPWVPGAEHFDNPPYSQLRRFLAKAVLELGRGCTSTHLIPARTDTVAWHAFVHNPNVPAAAAEVRLVKGRIAFKGADHGAPFPSAIVRYVPGHVGPPVYSTVEFERAV